MSQVLSTEEVYFLVRVGSWDQQQLEAWVQDRIHAEYNDDYEETDDDFMKDWDEL